MPRDRYGRYRVFTALMIVNEIALHDSNTGGLAGIQCRCRLSCRRIL
jgi:hypothetical protein